MAIVNKFNVNNKQVTLDADIIENMSANDVPYDSSFQYNKNTVGDKLSKLESEIDVFKEDITDEVTVFKETVTEQVNNYKPIVINGNVTNAQDEEDLTSVDGLLKFKNRSTLNGMGYVILRKDKSFSEQVSLPNTIYEIRYDFTLNENITIPANCVLKFDGGSISGKYTLIGTNTYIDSNSVCIKKDIIISGTWSNETIYTRWFEFISTNDETTDNLIVFRQLRNIINGTKGCKVEFEQGYYQYGCDIKPADIIDGIPKYYTNKWNNDKYYALSIINIPYVDINLNGSVIKALTTNAPRFTFIAFVNISNAYIHDGSIIGFANTFSYPIYIRYDNTQVRSYEWSHAIIQMGGFLTVRNINVSNFHGDGIMVGTDSYKFKEEDTRGTYFPSKGYSIENCEVSYCARNGITLHSSYTGQLKNVYIHNIGSDGPYKTIGTDGIMGTSPRAGIDVEFEDGQGLIPVMNWENLYIHDCRDKSFVFAPNSTMKNFSCKNSIFFGLGLPNNLSSETRNNVFSNCYFKHTLSSTEGTLYGKHITYNNCSFVFDKADVLIGLDIVFNNCTFIDERTDTLNKNLYSQAEQLETKYNHCYFYIKGSIGCLGAKSKFYTCTFNIPVITSWYISNANFYNCIFHNSVQDSDKCFQFVENNIKIDKDGALSFERCVFDKSYGQLGTSMDQTFFFVSKLKLKDCEFKSRISLIMWDGYDFIIKNITSPKVYSRPYSPPNSTLEPYKLYIDNCKFENFLLEENYKDRYDNSITIKDSEITTASIFENINMEGGKLNTGTSTNINKIRSKNSIIELPKLNSSNTETFNLENCYVSGISEANFQGTAINCTFKVPFPKSGTFDSRPITSPIGFKYFCTDKQTIEGSTDGIEIIHKGNDVWVDALGRVVS